MSEAPERIYTNYSGAFIVSPPAIPLVEADIEWVRADRIEELVIENTMLRQTHARAERLEAAMRKAILLAEQPHYGDRGDALDHCFYAIKVLRDTLKGTEHE